MSQLTSLIHFFRNKPSNHNTEKLIKLADRKINAAALLLASTLFLLIVIPYSLNEYSLRLRDRESDILAPFERSIEQIERALIDIDNDQLNYFIDQKKENLLNFQIYQNILTTELKQALKYTNDIGENAADLTNSLLAKVQLWTVNYAHPLHQEALRGDISLPRLNSLLKSGRITLDSARRSIEQIRTTLARKRNTTHLRIAKLTRWSLLGTVILGFLSLFANAYLFRFSRHTANLYRRAFKNYQTSTGKASQLESQLSFSQALLKNTPLGIAVIETRDLTVKYGNHAFERLPFLKSLDVLHQSLKESLNDGPATRQFLNTIEKTDCSLKQVQLISNVEYNSPGSMPSFWNFRAVPFGEKEGATAEHLLLIWDDISVEKAITEQIKNERQEASHREFELQVILDHMDDGVIVVNAQNEMTLINSQARLLLNIPKDLRLPQPVSAFPKEVIQAMSVDEWPKPIEKDSSVQFEKKESRISFYPASGRLLEMITTPSRDDSFNLVSVVAVLHDITAHKKAEKEKDEFLSVASHELKTPLTIIDLSCQIIKKSLKNGNLTQLETANNHLAAQLRRIKLLVLQLFDFANLQSAHFAIQVEKVDLCKLLSRVVEDNRSLSSEHALELQLPTTCPIVLADPTRMEKNIRVLVIDDETAILETTSLVFQLDSGFEVFTLKDSLKWKETIEQVRPQILLLDYRMPHMNGDEVIEALNLAGLRASINVLALFSATPFPSSAIQKLGADVFFEKPFEIEYLLSKLRELFKTSQERDSIVLA